MIPGLKRKKQKQTGESLSLCEAMEQNTEIKLVHLHY
jgi:hypothetical protein